MANQLPIAAHIKPKNMTAVTIAGATLWPSGMYASICASSTEKGGIVAVSTNAYFNNRAMEACLGEFVTEITQLSNKRPPLCRCCLPRGSGCSQYCL